MLVCLAILIGSEYRVLSVQKLTTFDTLLLQGQYSDARSLLLAARDTSRDPVLLAKFWTVSILLDDTGALASSVEELGHSPLALEQKALLFGHWFHHQQLSGQALQAWNQALSSPALQKARFEGRLPKYWFDLIKKTLARASELISQSLSASIEQPDARIQAMVDSFFGGESVQEKSANVALQRPSLLRYPQLRAQPFWDFGEQAWHQQLIDSANDIRNELQTYLAKTSAALNPYVRQTDGAPASWSHLIEKNSWQALHLMKAGKETEVAAAFPETLKALKRVPLSFCGNHAPEAFFSVLQAKTHIPPHYGLSNFKLVAHLPILLPGGCSLTAGKETRQWQQDKLLVFDDSFLHEAKNESDQQRIVLIFDIWHPDLSNEEKQRIRQVMTRLDQCYQHYPALMSVLKTAST